MALLSSSSPKWIFPAVTKTLREQVPFQIGGLVQIIKVIAPTDLTADTYTQRLTSLPSVLPNGRPPTVPSTIHPEIMFWLSDSQHCIQAYLTSTAIDNLYRNDDRIDTLHELQGSTVRLQTVSLCTTIHNDMDTPYRNHHHANTIPPYVSSSIERIRYEPDVSFIVDKFEYIGGIGNQPVGQPQQFNYDLRYLNILQYLPYNILYTVAPRYSSIDNYLLHLAHYGTSGTLSSPSYGILINLSIHEVGIEPDQRKWIDQTERKYQQRKYQRTKETTINRFDNDEDHDTPIEYPFIPLTAGTSSSSSSSSINGSTVGKSSSINSGSTCPLFDDDKPVNHPVPSTNVPIDDDAEDIEYTPLTQISRPPVPTIVSMVDQHPRTTEKIELPEELEHTSNHQQHKRSSSDIDHEAPKLDDTNSVSLAIDVPPPPSDTEPVPQPLLKKLKSNITNRLLKGRNIRNHHQHSSDDQENNNHQNNYGESIAQYDESLIQQPSTEIMDFDVIVTTTNVVDQSPPNDKYVPTPLPTPHEPFSSSGRDTTSNHIVNHPHSTGNNDELEQIYQEHILPSYPVSDEQPQPTPGEINKQIFTPYTTLYTNHHHHNANKLDNKVTPMLRLTNTPTIVPNSTNGTKHDHQNIDTESSSRHPFVSPVPTDNQHRHTYLSSASSISTTLPPVPNSATQVSTAASSGYYGSLSSYSTERTTQSSTKSSNSSTSSDSKTKPDVATPLTTGSTRSPEQLPMNEEIISPHPSYTEQTNQDLPFTLWLSNQKPNPSSHHVTGEDRTDSNSNTNNNNNNLDNEFFVQVIHNNTNTNNSEFSHIPLPNAQPPVSMTTLLGNTSSSTTTSVTATPSLSSSSSDTNTTNVLLPGGSTKVLLPSPSPPVPMTIDDSIVFNQQSNGRPQPQLIDHENDKEEDQNVMIENSPSLLPIENHTSTVTSQLTPVVDLQQSNPTNSCNTEQPPKEEARMLTTETTTVVSSSVSAPPQRYYTRIKPNHAAYRWLCSMDASDDEESNREENVHPRMHTLVASLQPYATGTAFPTTPSNDERSKKERKD